MHSLLIRATALSFLMVLLSGCGYVHFGTQAPSDTTLLQENTDLRVEKKLLQQELLLARKEGEALKTALEQKVSGVSESELAAKLAAATQELNTLRADYARLQTDGNIRESWGQLTQMTDLRQKVQDAEARANKVEQDRQSLLAENARLREELRTQQQENTALATQVKDLAAEGSRLREAVSHLNTELLAQKEARTRAENVSEAMRTQVRTLNGQKTSAALTLAETKENKESGAATMESSGLQLAKTEAEATAVLRINRAKLGLAETPVPNQEGVEVGNRSVVLPTTHVVREGDTLERIAKRYYGQSERWRWIYAANNTLLRGGRPLRPGMELTIPESSP